MRASVIIPSHRSQQTLPRTLQSLEVAAKGLEIETVVIEDAEVMIIIMKKNMNIITMMNVNVIMIITMMNVNVNMKNIMWNYQRPNIRIIL